MGKTSDSVKVINGGFGGVYFLAAIGAAVYFVQNSRGLWEVVLAILKAFIWPVFLIHTSFKLLGV